MKITNSFTNLAIAYHKTIMRGLVFNHWNERLYDTRGSKISVLKGHLLHCPKKTYPEYKSDGLIVSSIELEDKISIHIHWLGSGYIKALSKCRAFCVVSRKVIFGKSRIFGSRVGQWHKGAIAQNIALLKGPRADYGNRKYDFCFVKYLKNVNYHLKNMS